MVLLPVDGHVGSEGCHEIRCPVEAEPFSEEGGELDHPVLLVHQAGAKLLDQFLVELGERLSGVPHDDVRLVTLGSAAESDPLILGVKIHTEVCLFFQHADVWGFELLDRSVVVVDNLLWLRLSSLCLP